MKYILMMHCPRNGYGSFGAWPKDAIREHMAFMHRLNGSLSKSGEFVMAEGLADPQQAVTVRADRDGTPITDGVFPEAKEFLAGYWIVEVDAAARAHAIAAQASAAPGPDGKPMNMSIEVRQVLSAPPAEFV